MSHREQSLAERIDVVKIDHVFLTSIGLVVSWYLLGLLDQICHQFGDHVAHNLDILVVDLLLQVIETRLDDVTIQLLGHIQLCDQIHVAIHLLTLPHPEFIVVTEIHHWLAEAIIVSKNSLPLSMLLKASAEVSRKEKKKKT